MTYDTINNAQTIAGSGGGTILAGRYRIVRQLGQGGMGSVWLAEDTQLDNKPFAIKMLPSILVANRRAYRQLKEEALVAMRLVHPNIVQIRAFEENNGNPFLVMDYVDGETLDDYLAEHSPADATPADVARPPRPCCKGEGALATSPGTTSGPPCGGLPEADVIRILKPIAAALDYAHSKGVVHRDVKPGNVMIAKDGTPYILDFGIAREIQETLTRVTGKLSSGTLLYMSPEQLNGDMPKKEQDIYSFAAMAYECLKGEPPFVRGQIEHQILNNPPDPLLMEVLTGNAAILAAGIMAGLAKKPEDRPASCTAVLRGGAPAASVQTANESDKSAAPPNPNQPGGSLSRAVLMGILTVTVIGLIGLATLGAWWWASGRNGTAETETSARPSPVVIIAGHKGIQLWEGGPYWAETNIGAEKPEDYGYYFWWGDTVGYKRVGDIWMASDGSVQNFSFCVDNAPTFGKSLDSLKREGWITEAGVLAPEHDAAYVKWGGDWRMPTIQELKDLNSECNWTWTTMNGVNGYKVRGKGSYASASIFLPCAGDGNGSSLRNAGSRGYYWSSVPGSDRSKAWSLYFNSDAHVTYCYNRFYGRPVRPVQGFTK